MKRVLLTVLLCGVLLITSVGCREIDVADNVDTESIQNEDTENNYEKISLNFKGDVTNLTPNTTVGEPSVLEVRCSDPIVNMSVEDADNSTYEQYLYLVPLKSGTTDVETELVDGTTKKAVLRVKYNVTIDENLRVTYKEVVWEEE